MSFKIENFISETKNLLNSNFENRSSNPNDIYSVIEIYPAEIIGGILREIWRKCQEDRSLKDVLSEIIESESPDSNYNFIPSLKNSECSRLCVGIATEEMGANKKGDKRVGFDGLMRLTIENWLNCNEVNNTTVLITANWDEKKFDRDWLNIINTRVKNGKKVLVIQVSKNGFLVQYPVK